MPDAKPGPGMPCPLCAAPAGEVFAVARDLEYCTCPGEAFTYRQCPRCRAVYIDPPPVDRLPEIYPSTYYSFQERVGRPSLVQRIKEGLDARVFRKVLAKVPGETLRVLDVGGGSGWLLTLIRTLSPRVAHTHEVDIDESARPAAEKAGHHFHCAKVEDFRTDERFDLILMLNLIEHVADPAAVLRRMSRLLSPSGVLVIKTPNTDTLDRRLFQHRNWAGLHCPRHFVLFTRPGLIDLARRCGLECLRARYTQGGPQWAFSIMGVMMSRGWLRVTHDRPMWRHPLSGPLSAAGAAFDFLRMPVAPTAQMILWFKAAEC